MAFCTQGPSPTMLRTQRRDDVSTKSTLSMMLGVEYDSGSDHNEEEGDKDTGEDQDKHLFHKCKMTVILGF